MTDFSRESVSFQSLGDTLAAVLFLPASTEKTAALIVCHGAGDFKENYFELCEYLASRGVASLAVDMHGHGASSGQRFHVEMHEWIADVRAAVDFLSGHPRIDSSRIGAFGLSSGGTAILEAALIEPKLRSLITLDATVRNSLGFVFSVALGFVLLAGRLKRVVTGDDLRLPLAKLPGGLPLASDPEVAQKIHQDPRAREAFLAFPFPGAAEAFFVNTLKRVSRIMAPTLVLWGQEDRLDPPRTARLLFKGLRCKKQLHIIPGNGHVGHMDRNKERVFALTAQWALENLASKELAP